MRKGKTEEKRYYKIPMDISRLFKEGGGHLEMCGELESIDQHLGLLLTTHRGEHGFNPQYGTRLWELDFENIESKPEWEKTVVAYIKEAILLNETRLREVDVSIDVRDMVREEISLKGYSVRKRVDIIIQGTVVSTGKRQAFKHIIYLGPLSGD